MSVLVRGMEMPESCHVCVAGFGGLCYFGPSGGECECPDNGRPDWCPLVENPPHGRLIDADDLLARFEKDEIACDEHGRDFSFSFKSSGEYCTEWWYVQQMLMDAETVIPAEEES